MSAPATSLEGTRRQLRDVLRGALHPHLKEKREGRLRGRYSEAMTTEGSRPPPTNGGVNRKNQGVSSNNNNIAIPNICQRPQS